MSEINEEKFSKLWKLWENCAAYLKEKDYYNIAEKCTDFYEGRHWGKISNTTKSLPRVTINQVEMITNSKVSGILQSNMKVTFYSDKNQQKAEEMTRFYNYITKEMKFDETKANVVEEGAIVGSCPVYFYWDEDKTGRRGEYKGGLACEQLDLLQLGVANPNELDIQKQKWIILKTRQDVNEVRKLLEDKNNIELIKADDDGNEELEYNREQEDSKLCTVLTRFFRIDGEVYFEKATKGCMIHGPRPLNPNLVELDEDFDEEKEDGAVDNLSDKPEKSNKSENKFKASLYPVELYVYKRKKGCIYGRGEVEPLIMNNKAINFSFAMMAKSIEDIGFGQIVAKQGAIENGDRLSNDPTKILIDKYKGAGQGIYSLNKQPFPAQVPTAIEAIMTSSRSVSGATEVMTGETIGSNQSGTSIAYLQQQAQRPLNKLTERYKRFLERCAEIMEQFFVLYYEGKEYSYKKDEKIDEAKLAEMLLQGGVPSSVSDPGYEISIFNGNEYADLDFDIVCEAGAGSEWSELTELNMLETALSSGQIDFKTFIKAYPSHLITNKDELMKGIEATENSALAKAAQTIQALQQSLAQCQAYIKQQEEIVGKTSQIIKKNRELEKEFANLQSEYTNKINYQNQALAETTRDASEFAQAIFDSGNGEATK